MSNVSFQCPECGHVCTEAEMIADYLAPCDEDGNPDYSDEQWSNWICPSCFTWHQFGDWLPYIIIGD